ncbi:hypothetical protein L9F63_017889 [Diploptera punctata]|uniref:Uncharacterized protein n=1 Tax=Diploptera punctata TaxID=6984 RepID=A0AAD8EG52_DIPPU|nr:hypothetical protein L9F63_017889 [Diploptera punctata]
MISAIGCDPPNVTESPTSNNNMAEFVVAQISAQLHETLTLANIYSVDKTNDFIKTKWYVFIRVLYPHPKQPIPAVCSAVVDQGFFWGTLQMESYNCNQITK